MQVNQILPLSTKQKHLEFNNVMHPYDDAYTTLPISIMYIIIDVYILVYSL